MVPQSRRLNEAFGSVIREARVHARLTQEQLSFRADVHRTYVSDLERGLKSPTLDVVDRLSRALRTDSHRLLEAANRLRSQQGSSRIKSNKRVRTSRG